MAQDEDTKDKCTTAYAMHILHSGLGVEDNTAQQIQQNSKTQRKKYKRSTTYKKQQTQQQKINKANPPIDPFD